MTKLHAAIVALVMFASVPPSALLCAWFARELRAGHRGRAAAIVTAVCLLWTLEAWWIGTKADELMR